VLDLSCTDHRLSWFMSFLQEGVDVWNVKSEYVNVRVLDFFKPIQSGKERAPRKLLMSVQSFQVDSIYTKTCSVSIHHQK
jgi:hypothetical protein